MAIVYKNIVTEPNEKIDEAQTNFASLTDFNAAGGASAYGDGPVFIGGQQQYIENLKRKSPLAANRTTAQFAIYPSKLSPALSSFANADSAAVSVSDDYVDCTATGGSTGTNRTTGCKFEHPSTAGYWDMSSGTDDTLIGIDVEFFPSGGGDDFSFRNRFSIFLCTGAGSVGSTDFTNAFKQQNILNSAKKRKRMFLVFKRSDFASDGTPNWAQVRRIEMRWGSEFQHTNSMQMRVHGIYYGVSRKPRVVFSVDDGDLTAYNNFYIPYLKPNGWGCSFAINGDYIGDSGRMTVAHLKDLQNNGCELANHTYSHVPLVLAATATITGSGPWTVTYVCSDDHGLSVGDIAPIDGSPHNIVNGSIAVASVTNSTTFTATVSSNPYAYSGATTCYVPNPEFTVESQITRNSTFFKENGLIESGVFVYPGGINGIDEQELVESLGYIAARGVNTFGAPTYCYGAHYGYHNDYNINVIELNNTQTASAVISAIANAKAYGCDIHIYGHKFVETPALTTEFPLDELNLLMNSIAADVASGAISDVIGLERAVLD